MTNDQLYRIALPLCIVATLTLLFWGLGTVPLLTINEARRAVPVQEMISNGGWLLPTLNGEWYIAKPPLFYWLSASMAEIAGGVNEWIVRLPSALAALAVVALCFATAKRAFGRWPALFSVLVLITNYKLLVQGRRGEIEMLLTAFCTVSLLTAFRYVFISQSRWWIFVSYISLGLAALTKGPVALLFVTLPILIFALTYSNTNAWVCLRSLMGWCIFLTLSLSWYLAVATSLGFEAWKAVIAADIIGKVSNTHRDPFYNYLLSSLLHFVPWSLLLLFTPKKTIRGWLLHDKSGFLFCAFIIPLVALSLFADKHGKYMLPAYPAFALLLGLRLSEFYLPLRQSSQLWFKSTALGMVALYIFYFAFIEVHVYSYRYESIPRIVHFLKQGDDTPVYAYPDVDMRVVYYYGSPIPVLNLSGVSQQPNSGEQAMLLVEESQVSQVAEKGWCRLADFSPYLKRDRSVFVFRAGALCE